MRLNKNIKIFLNYFLGPLLFLWLSFSIYQQIQNQSHLEASWLHIKQSFQSPKIIYLLLTVLLMLFNWGLEAAKWRLAVRLGRGHRRLAARADLAPLAAGTRPQCHLHDHRGRPRRAALAASVLSARGLPGSARR